MSERCVPSVQNEEPDTFLLVYTRIKRSTSCGQTVYLVGASDVTTHPSRAWVCLCARSNSPVNAVGFVWVSVFCLWNVGVVPTRFTNNRPVQTVREWQRMLRQPKQRTQAHSTVFDPLLEENPPYMVESGRGVIRQSPIYLGSSTTFL